MSVDTPERLIIRADELEQDRLTQARCARFIGMVATNPEIVLEPVEDPHYENLYEAIRGAEINKVGRENVRANAHIATVEAIYKAGHVTAVKSRFRADGSVAQHGQTMMETYRNSLLFAAQSPQMHRRVTAEALNGHRIEDLERSGLLTDYWLFVPSLYPDDMTDKAASQNGFFADTKTAALQVTTDRDGACVTESAFVAGVTGPNALRHDFKAIRALYAAYGYDAENMTATDFLENPLLVHKSLMPNGITDIVKLFDHHAGGRFFGQDVPKQDYVDFTLECQNRETRLWDTVEEITNELIGDAGRLKSPTDAIKVLYQIVKNKVVRQAVLDPSIDARVFGANAFYHIEQARHYLHQGQLELANQEFREANRVADVRMCGMGGEFPSEDSSDDNKDKEVETDCDYISKKCPLCNRKNVRTHETKFKIECKECNGFVKKAA